MSKLSLRETKKMSKCHLEATGEHFFAELGRVFEAPDTLFKCVFKGKKISEETILSSIGVQDGSSIMALGTTKQTAALVSDATEDPLVKGFEKEMDDYAARKRLAEKEPGTAWGDVHQDNAHKFCKFGNIKRFENQKPTPYAAHELLRTLATDPGIVAVMKEYELRVGILEEMDPDDRYAAVTEKQRGGCLLGYNENGGQRIYLRLREASGGFRPYQELIDTVCHELTHNMVGPHDVHFWRIFGRIKSTYLKVHLDRKQRPHRYTRPKNEPTCEICSSVVDCEDKVRQKLLVESQANGALAPEEKMGAAMAAAEVELIAQIERERPPPPPEPERTEEEKQELRNKLAEAAAKRLGKK